MLQKLELSAGLMGLLAPMQTLPLPTYLTFSSLAKISLSFLHTHNVHSSAEDILILLVKREVYQIVNKQVKTK